MSNDPYKANFIHVDFADVKVGEVIFIDNYCDGAFPQASPLISGPYEVKSRSREDWIDLDCLFNFLNNGLRRSLYIWFRGNDANHLLKEKAHG